MSTLRGFGARDHSLRLLQAGMSVCSRFESCYGEKRAATAGRPQPWPSLAVLCRLLSEPDPHLARQAKTISRCTRQPWTLLLELTRSVLGLVAAGWSNSLFLGLNSPCCSPAMAETSPRHVLRRSALLSILTAGLHRPAAKEKAREGKRVLPGPAGGSEASRLNLNR
jgi:hypothetical protein